MAEAPGLTPIVYRLSDRLIVGEHPRGGVGALHRVATIAREEYELLLKTDPAYLSSDGEHVVAAPPT